MGKRLIKRLLERKYQVKALVRKGSEGKIPAGVETVVANPFDATLFEKNIPGGAVFVQLLGVPHPSPKKQGIPGNRFGKCKSLSRCRRYGRCFKIHLCQRCYVAF